MHDISLHQMMIFFLVTRSTHPNEITCDFVLSDGFGWIKSKIFGFI